MDLSRAVYSRDLKIAVMRALDAGSAAGEIARRYQLSPKLLERWRGEWRAKGELAFPGLGRRGADLPALDDARRIASCKRAARHIRRDTVIFRALVQNQQLAVVGRVCLAHRMFILIMRPARRARFPASLPWSRAACRF
jgi:transposase-like protein